MALCRFIPEAGGSALMTLVWMAVRGVLCMAVSNAAFFLIYRALPESQDAKRTVRKMPKLLGHIYTLLVVMLAFVIFRCDTLAQAGTFISAMFTGWGGAPASNVILMRELTPLFIATSAAACVAACPVGDLVKAKLPEQGMRTASFVGSIALLVLCVLSLSSGTYNPFIYFRF